MASRETHRIDLGSQDDLQPTQVYWFPDGERLLFLAQESGESPGLWIVSTFGGRPARIAENVARAAIAPDGSAIAYIPDVDSEGRGRREVWRMGPDGEDSARILSLGAGDSVWRVEWSPDASRLALGLWSFSGLDATRGARIELMNLDGGERREFISDAGVFQHWTGVLPFVWCADGTFLYATADSPNDPLTSNIWKSSVSSGGRLSGERQKITQWVGSNVRDLAASSDCGQVSALLVRNQADVVTAALSPSGQILTEESKVTFDEREDRVLAWSNDSEELIIQSSRSGTMSFYRLMLSSGELSRIAPVSTGVPDDPSYDFDASWDPSGRWIYYLDDGAVMQVPDGGGSVTTALEGRYRSVRCANVGERCVAGHVDGTEYVFTEFGPTIEHRWNSLVSSIEHHSQIGTCHQTASR